MQVDRVACRTPKALFSTIANQLKTWVVISQDSVYIFKWPIPEKTIHWYAYFLPLLLFN